MKSLDMQAAKVRCPGSGNLSLGGRCRMATCRHCGLLVLRVNQHLVAHEKVK